MTAAHADYTPDDVDDAQIICVRGAPGWFLLFNRAQHETEFVRSTVKIDLPFP